MEHVKLYEEIAQRTEGDIYIGVVGPVRTGKSTFIKRFMETLVIPNIENVYRRERARDELPQSGSGRTIMTAEPKFVPEEAAQVELEGGVRFSVRLIDSVGYLVSSAVGQTEDDRIVSGYEYEGVVVPQVIYFDGSQSVAVRDDGLTLYKGKQIPREEKNIKVEKEIVSTFCDDETIGLVFKNDDKEKQYTMQVYSTSGKLKFPKNFNIPYTTIKISDGNIIMYNSSQICVMSKNGKEKYI